MVLMTPSVNVKLSQPSCCPPHPTHVKMHLWPTYHGLFIVQPRKGFSHILPISLVYSDRHHNHALLHLLKNTTIIIFTFQVYFALQGPFLQPPQTTTHYILSLVPTKCYLTSTPYHHCGYLPMSNLKGNWAS